MPNLGMRDGEPSEVERLLCFLNQVRETQSGVHVLLGASDFLGESFDRVGFGLQLHESGIAPRFVEFVHIGALQVFDETENRAASVRLSREWPARRVWRRVGRG
jgi:hypothetical protein